MATSASVSTALQVFKTQYAYSEIERIGYTNHPFLGMVKKRTDFTGKSQNFSIRYSTQMGRSAVFATAKTNATGNKYAEFVLTRSKDYAVGGIDTEAIRASQNNGALVDKLKEEIDGLTEALTNSLAVDLYRNGGGNRGQIGAVSGSVTNPYTGQSFTLGTNQVSIKEPNDIVNFEKGMVLEASTADGTSGSRKSGQMTITSVDRDNGFITCSGGLIAGLAANDYLFVQDDFGAKIKGLPAWIPTTAPGGGDSFFSQDRSGDPVRLAGVRWVGNGGSIPETLQNAMARVAREGGIPDKVFGNPWDVNLLTQDLGAKTIYSNVQSTSPSVGYESIKLVTQFGKIDVISDPGCPKGTMYALRMDSWVLWTLGGIATFMDDDGNGKVLRDLSADNYQFSMVYMAQLACKRPAHNCVITL